MRTSFGIEDMKKQLQRNDFDIFYFLTHPSNLELLQSSLKEVKRIESPQFFSKYFFDPYYDSIEIRTDASLPRFAQRWEFPATPFTQYDEKIDRIWAEPVRFGRLVDTTEPLFYKIQKWPIRWPTLENPWKLSTIVTNFY